MMTCFKKDKLFEAIKNLSNDDKVKLHNYFNDYIVNFKVWRMDQLDEYFQGCTPHEIVDCITVSGDNFNMEDPYFYEDDYKGLVSIHADDLYSQEPFTNEHDYIAQLEDHETTKTGISAIDKILALPDMDPATLKDELYCKIDSSIDHIIKAICKRYNLDCTSSEHNDFNHMLDLEHELTETLFNMIFADEMEV